MKRLIAVAIMALGLVGVSVSFANAHHNSSHSQGLVVLIHVQRAMVGRNARPAGRWYSPPACRSPMR